MILTILQIALLLLVLLMLLNTRKQLHAIKKYNEESRKMINEAKAMLSTTD